MGGTASEARRGDGAKRKSVRKSCRSAVDSAPSALEGAPAAASGSSCKIANPPQVRQIASQTGVLLRQMRFVAGRGSHREETCWQKRTKMPILCSGSGEIGIGKKLPVGMGPQQMPSSRCPATAVQQPRPSSRANEGTQLQNGKLLLLLIFITFNENLSKYFSYE